jgi:hypothetical protein
MYEWLNKWVEGRRNISNFENYKFKRINEGGRWQRSRNV